MTFVTEHLADVFCDWIHRYGSGPMDCKEPGLTLRVLGVY